MKKKLTLIASSTTVLALTLVACGVSSNSSKLSDISYSMNDATAEPSVSFATPFVASGAEAYKISDGEGDAIKDGDNLLVDATVFNGSDGTTMDTTYSSTPMIIPVGEELKKAAPDLYDVLINSKVGTSFSYSTNVDIASTETAEATPTVSPGTATNVEVYTVSGKLLKLAEGKTNEKQTKAVESFSLSDDGGAATLKLAEDRGDAPTELHTEDLIVGNGPAVKETDNLYVNYVGVKWSDGSQFDGNYGSTPAALSLSQVIEGWTKGLAGKTVGSRVLLTIPSELAYGEDAASSGAPEGALVFVVDILGSSPARADSSASAEASEAPDSSSDASESASAGPSSDTPKSASAEPSESPSDK